MKSNGFMSSHSVGKENEISKKKSIFCTCLLGC